MIKLKDNTFLKWFPLLEDDKSFIKQSAEEQPITFYLRHIEKRLKVASTKSSISESSDSTKRDGQRVEWKKLKAELMHKLDLNSSSNSDNILQEIEAVDNNFHSVVMIVDKNLLEGFGDKSKKEVTLSVNKLNERQLRITGQLASDIPFGNQPSIPCIGTGFFLKTGIIATAAHVLLPYQDKLRELAFIRNIHFDDSGKINNRLVSNGEIKIDKNDLFFPIEQKLKKGNWDFTVTNSDWSIVSVETGTRQPTTAQFSDKDTTPNIFREIYCIGHGLGLPKKKTLKAAVIKNNLNKDFFEAKFEVFSGNSGSPVFFADTHNLAGILVRGSAALVAVGENKYQLHPTGNKEEGEECQKISSEIINAINNL